MARHYNPWQERFDAVCKKYDESAKEYRKTHPIVKSESLQDKFDRVCNKKY